MFSCIIIEMLLFYVAFVLLTLLFIFALWYRNVRGEPFETDNDLEYTKKDAEYSNASWVMNAIYN